MKLTFSDIPQIASNSLRVIGQHWSIYIISVIYLVIAGVVIGSIAFIGFSMIAGFTIGMIFQAGSLPDSAEYFWLGLTIGMFFCLIIVWSFISGFFGGLGQMLKRVISTNQVLVQDYISGVFSSGPRLFFGFLGYSIIFLLPVAWGVYRLLDIYSLFDFSTMESGWNSQLRHAIGNAQSGTIFSAIAIQVILSILLGFWWVILISESRNFVTSFFKSIAFVLSNPLVNVASLLAVWFGMAVVVAFFAALFGMIGSNPGFGVIIGMILYFPFAFVFLIQIYDTRYRKVISDRNIKPFEHSFKALQGPV
jgi:hypothetical protein